MLTANSRSLPPELPICCTSMRLGMERRLTSFIMGARTEVLTSFRTHYIALGSSRGAPLLRVCDGVVTTVFD